MIELADIILYIKYTLGAIIFFAILMAPAWVARQCDKDKTKMTRVRAGSWLFGWSIIGWFIALFIGIRK